MDAKLKKQWIKALRSGKYEQGEGRLCVTLPDGTDTFCCLGVLADIGIDGDWDPEPPPYGDGQNVSTVWCIQNEATMLSEAQLSKLGLDEGVASGLAAENDSGIPFDRIADIIEEKVKTD